jgi:hypothetical protein
MPFDIEHPTITQINRYGYPLEYQEEVYIQDQEEDDEE